VNNAVEEFFVKGLGGADTGFGSSGAGGFNQVKAQQVFDKYKDKVTKKIEIEGLQEFFEDLGISGATDIITMYISFKMNAENMGVIKQEEFLAGFKAMGVSTMEDLKKRVP
jgi:predicted peroxiredoxin